jgi:hypothetical protein
METRAIGDWKGRRCYRVAGRVGKAKLEFMQRPLRLIFLACVAALATAGSPEKMVEKFASDADQKRAIELIEMMRHREGAALEPLFSPSIKTPETPQILERMADSMPAGEPRKRTLVGAYKNFFNGEASSNLTYQYDFGDKWFLINCAYRESGPDKGIFGMNVVPIQAALKAQPDFGLRGKSPLQYGVLIAAILALALTLVALISCIRERGLRKKWLWVLFILFGVLQLSVDWSSGAWQFRPLFFLLFSASAVFQPYGSWVVSVAVPMGALFYMARRIWNHPRPQVSNPASS